MWTHPFLVQVHIGGSHFESIKKPSWEHGILSFFGGTYGNNIWLYWWVRKAYATIRRTLRSLPNPIFQTFFSWGRVFALVPVSASMPLTPRLECRIDTVGKGKQCGLRAI